jgi:hypothetical protein
LSIPLRSTPPSIWIAPFLTSLHSLANVGRPSARQSVSLTSPPEEVSAEHNSRERLSGSTEETCVMELVMVHILLPIIAAGIAALSIAVWMGVDLDR